MIKKFIKSLLTKANKNVSNQKANIITNHHINDKDISINAIYVVNALQNAGYEAFIVGGAVRDLLIGIKPKDFDIATNATPEQICKLFRKARIIGKRFQIVLLPFYQGKQRELIEITTFRSSLKHDDII